MSLITGNSSNPKKIVHDVQGRVNVSKCTPKGPSTLTSANLVLLMFLIF